MQDTNETAHPVLDALKNVKTTVENFTSDKNVAQVKATVKTMVKDAQKDFAALVNKDLAAVKKKFAKERSLLDKELKKQTDSAKKFIATQKKEISTLQARLEKLVKAKKTGTVAKITTKKVVATRKTIKKATKKVARK
jgi:DNA polymerase III delta prime subunit